MDGRFLTAFLIPHNKVVLGYELKPYNLRHMMTLTALDSPFVSQNNSSSITPDSILVLLRVCSTDEPCDAFKKPTLKDQINVGRMMGDESFMYESIKGVLEYLTESLSSPAVFEKDGMARRPENVPSPLALAVLLMSRLGFSPEAAWKTPVGQAIWYSVAYSVQEGADVKILSTEAEAKIKSEKELIEKVTADAVRQLKELAKKQKKNG